METFIRMIQQSFCEVGGNVNGKQVYRDDPLLS